MGKLWKFHLKILTGFRNTKLSSQKSLKKHNFLRKMALKNNFPLQSFVFLRPVNIFEWNFQECFPIEFPWKWSYFFGHGNCLMPAMPIFQKHCFFKNCPKNLTNFGKFKIFFCISCCNIIGLSNGISFVFILLVLWAVQAKT